MKEKKEKFYKKPWFIYLMLVIFTPIGLIFLWVNGKQTKKTKWVLTGIFSVWFIFMSIASQPTEEEKVEEAAREAKVEQERQDKKEAKEKEKKERKEKKKAAEEQKKKEEEQKEKEEKEAAEVKEKAIDEWPDYKGDMLEHYEEVFVLDIDPADENYNRFLVMVPNELKMETENEKLYYVEEVAPMLKSDLQAHFGEEPSLTFVYEDISEMATEKLTGGYKIQK